MESTAMFCNQCEQHAQGGCTRIGVCGKAPTPASLQDLIVYTLTGLGWLGEQAVKKGMQLSDETIDVMVDGLFITLTNVNFDPDRLNQMIDSIVDEKKKLEAKLKLDQMPAWVLYVPPKGTSEREAEAVRMARWPMPGSSNDNDASLRTLILLGLKGMAAYAHHAAVLGHRSQAVDAAFFRMMAQLQDRSLTVPELLQISMELGNVNLECMALLDGANTGTYGHPTPTRVRTTPIKGKCIVVSGHDLKDIYELLEQTEGKGINIYTHGEMLPSHGYPKLHAFKHLVGNFGGAWQDQQKEFDGFPGAILMTTNCLQKPRASYDDRIYTTGTTGWPGITHLQADDKGHVDFTPLIEKALSLPGFTKDEEPAYTMTGFGHHATLSAAPQILEAVKAGQIRHFFLVGGCDGAKSGRNYYTDFATKAPKDTIILTLACGKFRFNKLDLGTVAGLPRMLDMGQCNDAYSAIKVALGLAEALQCTVHDLPLSLILSWYEQKAVCILLTLLALGLKRIHLGPSLPDFLSPDVIQILVDQFQLTPIGDAQEDLDRILSV